MSDERKRGNDPGDAPGATTAGKGTPIAVDVSEEGRARTAIALFLSGPVIWSVHFMVVYLVVEAGCSAEGPGLDIFDPPIPTVVTHITTAVAVVASAIVALLSYRRWQARRRDDDGGTGPDGHDRGGSLAFGGLVMALLGIVVILFVGLPALVLPAC